MSTTKHWRSRKNGTKRKNSSIVSNWTNCWCGGNRKHRGLEKPRRTHYSKRFSTSRGPTRISSRSARSSTRKECEIRFENRTKSASSWSKGTTASNCQRLVGYATATAVKFLARYSRSPLPSGRGGGQGMLKILCLPVEELPWHHFVHCAEQGVCELQKEM